MTIQRRQILTAAGAMLVLSDGMLRLAKAQPAPEADPATRHADPRIRAAGHAIRAPNPHNRQPWLVQLAGADRVLLRCDLDRRLPETDPFDRQIVIGLGGFLELYRMALAQEGIGAEITRFPEGLPGRRLDQRPIAAITLRPGAGM
ncbi:MAG: twin-arginine translocation pathway signal protein, partial [Alphaproteobacteria bacterium]